MLKMFRKTISLFMAIVFVMTIMPHGAVAEDAGGSSLTSKIISFSKPANSRKNIPGTHYTVRPYDANTNYIRCGNNDWYAYVQLDLTGYEEILGNESTDLKLSLRGLKANYPMNNYVAYAINDAIEDYDDQTITYTSANSQGLHKFSENAMLIASDGNVTDVKKSVSDVDDEAFNSVLAQGLDNSIVTIVFEGMPGSAQSCIFYQYDDCGLVLDYDPSEINNQEYIDTLLANVNTLEDLIGEGGLTEETGLPNTYRGMDVAWQSSDPDYITNDGKVYHHLTAKDVTLTATFSYKGIDENATLATATKAFTVNVEAETPVEVKIPFTNSAYSRHSYPDEAFGVQSKDGVAAKSITTGGDFEAYTQFNLRGYEEIIKNPNTTVQIQLVAGMQYSTQKIYNVKGILAPDQIDSYNWETITYNTANQMGFHNTENRPVLFEKNDDVEIKNGSMVTVDASKDALLTALEESDINSVVSVYLAGGSGGNSMIRVNNENTCLVIKYYESEIDDDAFFADIESSFTLDKITGDPANALVNTLPTYYKGADIVWSSAEGYVTSSGEITLPSDSAIVNDTVTATVTYKDKSFTKNFAVTLCNGNLVLGTPAILVEDGVATGSIRVINATGEDASYILYLAVYDGGELINLVPGTLNAAKGTEITKTLTADVADGNKVKFFVWKADGITPVVVAAEN